MSKFWNFVKNEGNEEEIELRIDGDIMMDDDFWSMLFGIEGVTPKGFMAELAQHKNKNITVWINSYGGDVYAASRIYTALKDHKGIVKVKIDGVAMSAASVIAMAGSEVMMSPTSILMIHNPWGISQGESKDMRQMANILDEVKETIMNAYQLKSKHARNYISKMMDEETWMGAKKAKAEGFIDGILFTESKDEPAMNSFSFSRMAIQNGINESSKRFIEQYKEKYKELNPEESRQVPVDLYTKLITNHERSFKL